MNSKDNLKILMENQDVKKVAQKLVGLTLATTTRQISEEFSSILHSGVSEELMRHILLESENFAMARRTFFAGKTRKGESDFGTLTCNLRFLQLLDVALHFKSTANVVWDSPWIIQYLCCVASSLVIKNYYKEYSLGLLSWITLSHVGVSNKKWERLLELDVIQAVCSTMWIIPLDFKERPDYRLGCSYQDACGILHCAISQSTHVRDSTIAIIKPIFAEMLSQVSEEFLNDAAFIVVTQFLCDLIQYDRSVVPIIQSMEFYKVLGKVPESHPNWSNFLTLKSYAMGNAPVSTESARETVKSSVKALKGQGRIRQCAAKGCWKSSLDGHELKICSRCKVVYYCSVECQKANWKAHKKVCKTLAKRDRTALGTQLSCNMEDRNAELEIQNAFRKELEDNGE